MATTTLVDEKPALEDDLFESSPLVLVAEDDSDLNELLVLRIRRIGFDVIAVSDGEEALRMTAEHKPQVLVLDIVIPEISGKDVIKEVRKNPSIRTTPILVLTGYGVTKDVHEDQLVKNGEGS